MRHAETRLIPACAGTTVIGHVFVENGRAHPRLRGDYCLSYCLNSTSPGSSPPARGLLYLILAITAVLGLIPACAGTTILSDIVKGYRTAHPRLRGDYSSRRPRTKRLRGSSPPARGLPFLSSNFLNVKRLIPACAGTTQLVLTGRMLTGAHPRLRGDYAL